MNAILHDATVVGLNCVPSVQAITFYNKMEFMWMHGDTNSLPKLAALARHFDRFITGDDAGSRMHNYFYGMKDKLRRQNVRKSSKFCLVHHGILLQTNVNLTDMPHISVSDPEVCSLALFIPVREETDSISLRGLQS